MGKSRGQFYAGSLATLVFFLTDLNFVLVLASSAVYAAISSISFSLLATGIDATFDLGSNVLLFYLHKKASRMDVNKWPVGGARLETIGNIVYGMLVFYTDDRAAISFSKRFFVRTVHSLKFRILKSNGNVEWVLSIWLSSWNPPGQ
jgi:divalent metal cation (Fe/Co/Zn/Cd) transporter